MATGTGARLRWWRMMESGRFASRALRLTLLAPDNREAFLDGRQPEGMTLPRLLQPFPVEWERQH